MKRAAVTRVWRAGWPLWRVCGLAIVGAVAAGLKAVEVDLDADGRKETVSITEAGIVVEGGHLAGTYPLPEGVPVANRESGASSVRFVDVSGDGLADLLFADAQREAIHLWTKVVRSDLGWASGWTHKVRAGERVPGATVLPPLAGAVVSVVDGVLVIREADASETRMAVRDLIALPVPPRLGPSDALATLKLPEGFSAELVAHEPEVMDPVAFDWGPDGRLWVVEMADYPTGLDGSGAPGGRVKVLADEDGDGRYEKATVFADGLPFPTGVFAWRDGVLIAAAPDILFCADTDGDGKADRREVLFSGFEPGNQQHRFNGFDWGLDGWVYAANGDSGGTVRSSKTGATLSISGRDVRFRPDTGEMETVSGMTQYGLRRDDWGNWFGNNNPVWLWQVTLPERYLRRNPELAVTRVRRELANYPDSTRVFPVSPPMERPNQPWALNHVTSACSPTPYRDAVFGSGYAGSVFIAEPVHNVVHREVLEREGAGWRSRRADGEESREFLASTDNWFRPVFLRTGPDGALWVADMQRIVLEHPEWISPEMQARIDVRAGAETGRIYRIIRNGQVPHRVTNLALMDAAALAAAMDSPNGWQRDTVHRLLLEKRDPAAIGPLRALLAPAHAPEVRVQALAALGSLGGLREDELKAALGDPNPWVRCEALRQCETRPSEAMFPLVAALAGDADPAVRQQVAFSLGAWPPDRAEPVLAALADGAAEEMRVAVLSSLSPGSALFRRLNDPAAVPLAASLPALRPTSPNRAKVIAQYKGIETFTGDESKGAKHFEALCAACHRLDGRGQAVGPDLEMTANKPTEWLLAAILDPAQTVESRYRGWNVTRKDGTAVAGVVAAETSNNLVLRLPGGTDHPVLRGDIKTMEPIPGSLMPEGFESALPPSAMADLLTFLRGGR
jgi:putative membrane-bound dehydrogenase-like protein